MGRKLLADLVSRIEQVDVLASYGEVIKAVGIVLASMRLKAAIGDVCKVMLSSGKILESEVVGVRSGGVILMPLGNVEGLALGSEVMYKGRKTTVGVGESLLGRVIDGLGRPIDSKGPLEVYHLYPLYSPPSNPLERRRIDEPMDVGIRAINGLITIGKGQRIGIFSGSGVGKTTLLGMMIRYAKADVKVIALIGERGREVKEFIEKHVGDALDHSVVVVATSEQPPLVRVRGTFIAAAVAEFFRDMGKDVLLIMDSLTRFAMAQREVGLSIGEPPASKGYTPSVFATMPKLLERAGRLEKGSITGFYTVLVEGDDMADPIADSARAILDGHIVLSRELAHQNHYPPIDVLASVSRLLLDITSKYHQRMVNIFKDYLAAYHSAEDLINIGAYVRGSNRRVDRAIELIDRMREYLRQDVDEAVDLESSVRQLREVVGEV